MAHRIKKITVNHARMSVTLVFQKWTYGWLDKTFQVTLSRREFERALKAAEITVPWDQANS